MNPVLETKSKEFQKKVIDAPLLPGCYMYKNKNGKVIYVGKAKNLRNRIKSYFTNYQKIELQKQIMVQKAQDIEIITVDSEVEALILEMNLIKKYRPKYNIIMRDDKSYIYIRLEKIRKKNQPIPTRDSVYQDFPRISVTRQKKDDGAEYYGPFPNTVPVKRILRKLRWLFPFRTTNELVYVDPEDTSKVISSNKRPSLYYHLGLSNGAEAGLETKENYLKNFRAVRSFLRGEKNTLLEEVQKKMKIAVENLNFEEAARLRDRMNDIKYVTANIRIDNSVDDIAIENMRTKEKKSGLKQLLAELDFPAEHLQIKEDFKIECYDISNIQGTSAVGSMVVMVGGEIQPQLYRRFRIKMKNEPNDFAMLQEVLTRRFKRIVAENLSRYEDGEVLKKPKIKPDPSFSVLPDLIIIDGGKGQLASTYKILYKFNLHNQIPIVGLAKREEEIFKISDQFNDDFREVNESNRFSRILLPRRSSALFLVQRIRDEAHRFAITYHRKVRSKKMILN